MKNVKLLFLDVDGTLTDGKIYIGNNGEIFKAFDVKDGCGIHDILPKYGITPIVITARESDIVVNRCKELNVEYLYQGCREKREKMIEVAKQAGIHLNSEGILPGTAYMGDDILDLQCMEITEVKGCPKDAVKEVTAVCDFISGSDVGKGAVREFIDWIIERQRSAD